MFILPQEPLFCDWNQVEHLQVTPSLNSKMSKNPMCLWKSLQKLVTCISRPIGSTQKAGTGERGAKTGAKTNGF